MSGGGQFRAPLNKVIAFTLAEVLITLGIIGIVAALTMPSLINKTQNKQFETALKVAYSIFSQAVLNMKEEVGPDLKNYYTVQEFDEDGNYLGYPRAKEFQEQFIKSSKLKIIGECNYTKIMNYNKTAEAHTSYIETVDGKEVLRYALSNGMCASFIVNGGAIHIAVDVNGAKRPNQLGYDIFFFNIDDDKLQPKKMTHLYSEDELEDMEYPFNRGVPCSVQSKQQGNGVGCAYYALIDQNPDDSSKGYWKSLP